MKPQLFLYALPPFAFGTSAYVFAGLLNPMAADLGSSVPLVAQLQTVFAIACAIGSPLLARITTGFDRRTLLVAVLILLATTNAVAALATGYSTLVAARIVGGFVGALATPVSSMMAVMIAPPERRAAALAIVVAGNTIAFLFGVPVGSVIGDAFGWRGTFWFATAICVVVACVIRVGTSSTGRAPSPPEDAFKRATTSQNIHLFAVTLLGFVATFCSIAFIGPIVTDTTGIEGGEIGAMQLMVGVGSIFGLYVGTKLSSTSVRLSIGALFAVIVSAQLAYVAAFAITSSHGSIFVVASAICLGAAALFAMTPIVQVRLAQNAGDAATIAFALNGSMIFLGQGLGAAVGGVVADSAQLHYVSFAGALVAILGLFVALRLPHATRSKSHVGGLGVASD
ncbi:MAG: MFS transporter [Pseudomonadota bacterium]